MSVINNLIPQMTSNTAPSGECKASSVYGAGREAFRAFDNDLNTMWTNNTGSAWISYTFPIPTIINEISILHGNAGNIYWNKIDLYGDGNLLCNILKSEGKIFNTNYTEFCKDFDNNNAYKEYKITFDISTYTYISYIQMGFISHNKYFIKQNNQYYGIKYGFYNIKHDNLTTKIVNTYGSDTLDDIMKTYNTNSIVMTNNGILGNGQHFSSDLNDNILSLTNIITE